MLGGWGSSAWAIWFGVMFIFVVGFGFVLGILCRCLGVCRWFRRFFVFRCMWVGVVLLVVGVGLLFGGGGWWGCIVGVCGLLLVGGFLLFVVLFVLVLCVGCCGVW